MYRAREKQMSIYDYLPPYHGELCNANRWVRLAAAIDWDGFEKAYSALFAPGGKVALPARVALGCRIIQLHYAASDREVVALVQESPYLQYFWGSRASLTRCRSRPARWRGSAPAFRIRLCARRSACCAAFSDSFM